MQSATVCFVAPFPSTILFSRPIQPPQPPPPDRSARYANLIAKIASGSEDALAELYDQTNRLVFSLALRILNDRGAAEEVTMDVFLQVWKQASNYSASRGTPLAWLMTMARTRSIDKLRSMGRNKFETEELDDSESSAESSDSPEEAAFVGERRAIVRAALAELSDDQRVLIEAAYFEGLTQTEIAERFKLPLGTVKTRVRSGMITLRRTLGN